MRPDISFYPQLVRLASCLCQEIEASNLPPLCFCGLLAGDLVPLDYCAPCEGACGMAWVRMGVVTQTGTGAVATPFSPVTGGGGCGPLEATIEVGIVRCAPGMDSDGNPPTMADQLEAANLAAADMAAGLRAIKCCFTNSKDYNILNWMPTGPQGGCLGGVWSLTIYEGM